MQKNIRLILDITKRNANVLFDKETGKRMTFRNPLVIVPFISESMKRAIRAGKVIDVDDVSGIEVNPKLCANHNRIMQLMGITKVTETVKPVEVKEKTIKEVKEESAEVEKKEEVKPSKAKSKSKKEVKEEVKAEDK